MARIRLSTPRMRESFLSSRFFPTCNGLLGRMMIDDDIDAIINRGEERTAELNSKYEALNLEDLSNFKSDASVQQWEGEDFRSGVSVLFASYDKR